MRNYRVAFATNKFPPANNCEKHLIFISYPKTIVNEPLDSLE